MRKMNENKKAYTQPYYEIEKFTICDAISTSSIDDGDDPIFGANGRRVLEDGYEY